MTQLKIVNLIPGPTPVNLCINKSKNTREILSKSLVQRF
jgi:hypothetical protein